MNAASLSFSARRRLQILAADVDKMVASDRAFFERWPERRHRVRRSSQAEIESYGIVGGEIDLPPDLALFTLTKSIAPGARIRLFIPGPVNASGEDETEEVAAGAWRFYADRTPWVRVKEHALEAAARRPGGLQHDGGAGCP